MRKTEARVRVAVELMRDPDGRHWGYETAQASGLRSGSLYPILHAMLDEGWLIDGWEDATSDTSGRPPRRYYKLTELGRRELGALAAAINEPRFRGLQVRWETA